MEFPNSTHPAHQLELKNYTRSFTCDGCKQPGFGSRYRCDKCDFDLHQTCMFPRISPSSHEFFPSSTFEFLKIPPPPSHGHCKRTCNACTKTINGFVYHCKKDDLDLHPCCSNLSKKYLIDGMEFKLHRNVQDKCMLCSKKRIRDDRRHENGWSYISQCDDYHFHLHVACFTQVITETLNKGGDGNGTDSINALVNVILEAIQARERERGGRGNKYWKIFKAFF